MGFLWDCHEIYVGLGDHKDKHCGGGRQEGVANLFILCRQNIGIQNVNLLLHAIVKTQPSTIQPPTQNKEFRQISDCSDRKIKELKKSKNQKKKN